MIFLLNNLLNFKQTVQDGLICISHEFLEFYEKVFIYFFFDFVNFPILKFSTQKTESFWMFFFREGSANFASEWPLRGLLYGLR